jgi:hypothetical protein
MKAETYYMCTGSVRGECGHHHKTRESAERCRKNDQRGCEKQGGYSDREVYLWDGNRTVPDHDFLSQ